MRYVFTLIVVISLCGCSAMLMGGGTDTAAPIGGESRSNDQLARDNAIASDVRGGLAADELLASATLSVSVSGGAATLRGSVNSFDLKDRAVQIARNIDGVTQVKNQIQVNSRN